MRILFNDKLDTHIFVQAGYVTEKTGIILPEHEGSNHPGTLKITKVIYDPSGAYPIDSFIASTQIGVERFIHEHLQFPILAIPIKNVLGQVLLSEDEMFKEAYPISREQIELFLGDKAKWSSGRDMGGDHFKKESTIIL